MARIIKKNSDLREKIVCLQKQVHKKKGFAFLFFAIAIASLMLTEYLPFSIYLSIVFVIIAIGFIRGLSPLYKEIDILQAGSSGERMTVSYIASLPDTYTVFTNLIINYENKSSETDIIVVGPTGVFIIETKNLHGSIHGNINDKYFCQYKIGRAGTPYTKSFYNPIKQVNTHVYRLAGLLRENGIRTYVNAFVYFSSIQAFNEIEDNNEKTAVFFASDNGGDDMVNKILQNNQTLTVNECKKIVDLLNT